MTPGVHRAGQKIAEKFRKVLPKLPDSTDATLAEIIDGETHATEMANLLLRAYTHVTHGPKREEVETLLKKVGVL